MIEEMTEREVRYYGQEAAITLNNKAFILAVEKMQKDAIEELILADPTNFASVAVCQQRVKACNELVERLEAMATRAAMIESEDEDRRTVNRDLN